MIISPVLTQPKLPANRTPQKPRLKSTARIAADERGLVLPLPQRTTLSELLYDYWAVAGKERL